MDTPAPASTRETRWLLAILALAAAARALRALARWDEVSWLYAAYPAPALQALSEGAWGQAFTGFVGLHPPLFQLLHAASELLAPVPMIWLGGSALLSWAAAAMVGLAAARGPAPERAWLAALCMACGPIQLAYAAEVNNYPLTVAAIAACWWARERVAAGRPWWELAIAGAIAVWSHALAGFVAGLLALSLGPRIAVRVGAALLAASAPLWPEVAALATEPGTYRQPPFKPALIWADYRARFGLLGILLIPLALRGALARPRIAAVGAGTLLFIGAVQGLRIAAPHQFPYLLAAGPPLALLVAAGARERLAAGVAAVVLLAQLAGSSSLDVQALAAIRADLDRERAIDAALAQAGPGDGIYLLSPPRLPDDDKRATSAVLWRISPLSALPMARPYDADGAPPPYDDHRHGQPRALGELTIYVNDWPRDELLLAAAAHPRLFVVAYDHRMDPRYTAGLAESLGVTGQDVGGDLLFVTGER